MAGKIIQQMNVVLERTNREPIVDNGIGAIELNGVKEETRTTLMDWFAGDVPIRAEIIIREV